VEYSEGNSYEIFRLIKEKCGFSGGVQKWEVLREQASRDVCAGKSYQSEQNWNIS
jgi:hypothetical protein